MWKLIILNRRFSSTISKLVIYDHQVKMYAAKLGKSIEMEKGKEEENMRNFLGLNVLISLLGSFWNI